MWIHDGDHSGVNQASNQTVQNTVVGATASNLSNSDASYFVASHKDTFMPVVEVTVTNGQIVQVLCAAGYWVRTIILFP